MADPQISSHAPLPSPPRPGEAFFRWRGHSVSRIENLVDATVALALTFTLISLDVPETFADLSRALKQLPVFGICCVFLCGLWYVNYKFHRRYALEDFPTFLLNSVLIILILYFVYPMKFLASLIFIGKQLTFAEASQLMFLYAGGFAAISIVFAGMHLYAWSVRNRICLNPVESRLTLFSVSSHLINAFVAVAAIIVTAINPKLAPFAGMGFFLIGPLQFVNGLLSGRGIENESPKL